MNQDKEYIEQKTLYEAICRLENIDGTFEFDDYWIIWRRNGDIHIDISTDYIGICKNKISLITHEHPQITHWHPDGNDEIIDYIKKIGEPNNVMVLCDVFPYILFCGNREQYLSKKRYRLIPFKKYFFGEINKQ